MKSYIAKPFGQAAIIALLISSPASSVLAATRWDKAEGAPGFNGLRDELRHLVEQDGRIRKNAFCVVRAIYGRDDVLAYAYWPQAHRLYTFEPARDQISDLSIQGSAPLDLKTDVVASERDVHGSTFLVTRAWVRNILKKCAQFGANIEISSPQK